MSDTNRAKSPEKKREINLELLRILAMLMVISLHYLGKGKTLSMGILYVLPSNANFANEVLAWTLEAASYAAVNLYIMISGYFLVNATARAEKLFKIFVQVLFYSIGIYLIFLVSGNVPAEYADGYHKSIYLLPVSSHHYWFASIYLLFYTLAPFLALGLRKMTKKQMLGLCVILLLITSRTFKYILPNMAMIEKDGYSILWMVVLFVVAAYIRRFVPVNPKKRFLYLGIYFLSVLATVGGSFAVSYVVRTTGHLKDYPEYLYGYNSPTIIIAAISLFLFFRTIKIKEGFFGKIILFFAPLTFGVYLLHEHFLLRDFWTKFWKVDVYYQKPYFILHYIGVVLAVFLIGAAVEWIRKTIFELIFKIKPFQMFFGLLGKADVIFPEKDKDFKGAE